MRSWICGGTLLALALTLSGCGSVVSTQSITQAKEQVSQARVADVADHSIYEAVLAESYLEQARIEWARSNWKHADKYAELASEWSQRAVDRAAVNGPATGVGEE